MNARSLIALAALVAVASAQASSHLVIQVEELGTGRALSNVKVVIQEDQVCTRGQPGGCVPQKPRTRAGRTNAQGVCRFKLPHERFSLAPFRVEGFAGSYPFHNLSELERRYKLFEEKILEPASLGRKIVLRLIPLAALKVSNAKQAQEAALGEPEFAQWLAQNPSAALTVKQGEAEWQVHGKAAQSARLVLVDALDGAVRTLGRWQ